MIGDGVAVFIPTGLESGSLPRSFALLQSPVPQGAVPSDWKDTPVFSSNDTSVRAFVPVTAGVDLYGGGEVIGPLRRNGTSITLWNTDNYGYWQDSGRRLYQSHPWILGVRADGSSFGLLFDSTWRATLDCTNGVTFTSQGPAFPVVVIEKDSPQAVLTALAELTGHMPLPPRWALGYQQCRYSYFPDSRVREIADNFRQRQIPCDVIWLDIDYMNGFRVFTFDSNRFPNPRGLNDYLHTNGFKSIWMIDPGVKVDTAYSVYQTGTAADVWVKNSGGGNFVGDVWPGACVFPDFTRPETRTWWSDLYTPFMAQGIDGIWNDMNEPAVFNTPAGTMPDNNWHRGGGDILPGSHLQYHNVYGMLMVQASREGILNSAPDKRPFVLTRANFLGGQRYAATWTGDNASTEEYLRLSTPMTLTLGMSGQPFNGPDIGGFSGDATGELWARWIGIGAFFPFSRAHASSGTNNKEPWAFGSAVEESARIALNRRYRLLPYLYTLFHESSLNGLPVMRPVFWSDLTNSSLRTEEQAFTLGSDLLVVPNWAPNPQLPGGTWREISLVPGDGADAVNQPRVLLRAGAILPLGRVVQNTTEESLSPLTLVIALDAQGTASGSLYEDAGNGFAYQEGDFLWSRFYAELRDGIVHVSMVRKAGQRDTRATQIAFQVISPTGDTIPSQQVVMAAAVVPSGDLISRVSLDAARYLPGQTVDVHVSLFNGTGVDFNGTVAMEVYHLGDKIAALSPVSVQVANDAAPRSHTFQWTAPLEDYKGYLAVVIARNGAGDEVERVATAIDVSSDWTKFPRYGYVTRFESGVDASSMMEQLCDFHINGIQFYDWQWKHHIPYSPDASWQDIAARTVQRSTVNSLIAAAHQRRMMAMNYNLYGGAADGYTTDGSGAALSMGIFNTAKASGTYLLADQKKVDLPAGWATRSLYQMNNRDAAWQGYIFGREATVFQNFDFDGWHIDSLGTHEAYDFQGNLFSLDDNNPAFVNNAKAALGCAIVFNTVDAGGESQIARDADVDFVYSELWTGNERYDDIRTRADAVRNAGDRALVLAAYMNRGVASGYFNDASVRLTDAAIFASGAAHLELGDGDKMLRTEYFVDDQTMLMRDSLKVAMRNYYNFLVAYENLLRDEVSSTGKKVQIAAVPTSLTGAPGNVWVMAKGRPDATIAHFINLTANTSDHWRDNNADYPAPPTLQNLAVKMHRKWPGAAGRLFVASPDSNGGTPLELTYLTGEDSDGQYVSFTLPRLEYWTMAWLEETGVSAATALMTTDRNDSKAGIQIEVLTPGQGGSCATLIGDVRGGSHLAFQNVDFGGGMKQVSLAAVASEAGASIEFRLDRANGPLVAAVPVPQGDAYAWQTLQSAVPHVTGVHDLYVRLQGGRCRLQSFQFASYTLPYFQIQPLSRMVPLNGTLVLSAAVSNATAYQWKKDGDDLAGATQPTLTILNFRAQDAGSNVLTAVNSDGSVNSDAAVVVAGTPSASRIANISVRASMAAGSDNMIAGFVIAGTARKTVLVRACGTSLGRFGIEQPIADPVLALHKDAPVIATNDNWGDSAGDETALAQAFVKTGAFAWSPGSKDAAILVALDPGLYTAVFTDRERRGGVGLVEVYEVDGENNASQLVNISGRTPVGTGQNVEIAGFVIAGTAPRRLLIRAAGPALDKWLPGAAIRQPVLALHSTSAQLQTQAGWDAALVSVFENVGAFQWTVGSSDSAVLVTLEPGAYTAVVSGANGTTGTALAEVYDTDMP